MRSSAIRKPGQARHSALRKRPRSRDLLTRYSKYAARRKPELIDAGSFRIGEQVGDTLHGGEFGMLVAEWRSLEQDMLRVKALLPEEQHPAYLQLVEHPIAALSNLYQLYYAVAWNRRLASAGDARANTFADLAEAAFRRDQALTDSYHRVANGKWDGMMSQTHIGYTGWQQPEIQTMPGITRIQARDAAKPLVFASDTEDRQVMENFLAIEAPHYNRAMHGKELAWQVVPHLGRTLGASRRAAAGPRAYHS